MILIIIGINTHLSNLKQVYTKLCFQVKKNQFTHVFGLSLANFPNYPLGNKYRNTYIIQVYVVECFSIRMLACTIVHHDEHLHVSTLEGCLL